MLKGKIKRIELAIMVIKIEILEEEDKSSYVREEGKLENLYDILDHLKVTKSRIDGKLPTIW